ncbi:MAG: hypothetical protein H0T79_16870 [Deltaproteobacteria bacterium]|nr:hypothetical protein [Deltaproteobacteria bacterium]
MTASRFVRVSVLAGGAACVALLSCGDDAVDPCPNGCTLEGTTVVKWRFNEYPEWKFTNDTCNEVGAVMVTVVATKTDDATVTETVEARCSDGQGVFIGLPDGTYDVSVMPLGEDGGSLVKAAVVGTVPAAVPGATTDVTINVPYTAWTMAYTGNFLYELRWGGKPCAMATPPVVTQVLTLTINGQPVAGMTHGGQKLDGSDPKPCATQFDYIEGLPFGPATFKIVGRDSGNAVRFDRQFDTFVGVGKFNPTIQYDMPPPDAALDAPPLDAPPDAPPL